VRIGYDRREGAFSLALTLSVVAIAVAWVFELGFGYVPCKLCLWQRWPYYAGIPVIFAGILMITRENGVGFARLLAGVGALLFAANALLGLYHAGVEWKFWPGPADCGGRLFSGPQSALDFRKALETARMVSCTEAPWRLLGLSFAGWNAVISATLAALCFRAASARG
jgi:disulfide bond formation protein DsbB